MISPDVLMVSLRCTEHPPDVLNIPRCTEHTLYRVITGMHTHCLFCLVYQYCIFWWSYYLLESKFYFVVLNHFCDSWLKIDDLLYFAKSKNTKIISSENKIILTRPSLVLTYSQDNRLCYFMILRNSSCRNSKQKHCEFFISKVTSWA